MARAVGLDIGSRLIKVVELSGSAKSFKVVRQVVREVPPPPPPVEGELPIEPEQAISNVLRDVFESLKLPKDDVCATFSAGTTVFREIQVPFFEDDQIKKVVRFEAENHLHSHSIDDVVVNWIKTGQGRDGSRLTVFASPKAELARMLGIVRAAGIEPASVDLDATALFTALDGAGVFKDHPNVMLLDVGARSTTLILVTEGRPRVVRAFLLGTGTMDKHLGGKLDLPPGQTAMPRADDLLVPASMLEDAPEGEKSLARIRADIVADERVEFVRKLHREAMRSLASMQADAAPDRILISGGGSLVPELPEILREKFGLPVERLDLLQRVDFKDTGTDPALTAAVSPAAIGCGLRMLGHNPLGIELLRDEFAPTNVFDVIKTALATAMTLLFLVLLLLAFIAKSRRDAETRRFNYAYGQAEKLFITAESAYLRKVKDRTEPAATAEINAWLARQPRDHTRANSLRAQMVRRHNELESELGLAKGIPQLRSGLEVWLEAYRAMNKVPRADYGAWLRVVKMDVTTRSATIRIEVDDQVAFDRIRSQFEASDYFKERSRNPSVVTVGPRNNVKGRWQQDFEFRFKEDE